MDYKGLCKRIVWGSACLISFSTMGCHLIFPFPAADYPTYNPYYCTASIYRDLPEGEAFTERYNTYLWPDQDLNQDAAVNETDADILCSQKIDAYMDTLMAPGFTWKKRHISIFPASLRMDGTDCTDVAPASPVYGGPWGSALSWQDPDGSGPAEIPQSDAHVWIKMTDESGNQHEVTPLLDHALVTLSERTGRPDPLGNYIRTDRHIRISHMEFDLKPFWINGMKVTRFHIHNIGTALTDKYGNFAAFEPNTIKFFLYARGEKDGESGETETCILNDRGTQINYVIYPQYFLFNLDTQFDIGGLPVWVKLKLASNYGKPFNMHQPYVSLPVNWVQTSPADLGPYFSHDHDGDLWKFLWFENFEAGDEKFLGKGPVLSGIPFSVGDHEITVVAYDSQGAYHTDTAVLTIVPPDDCTDALVVADGRHEGTLAAAANDGSASCDFASDQPDFWYSYKVRAPGLLSVNTCGTNDLGGQDTGMDTILSLHTDCTDIAGSELPGACNDDWTFDPGFSCLGVDSGDLRDAAVTLPVTGGQDILIRVSKTGDTPADEFVLNVTLEAAACPGDFDKDQDVDGKDAAQLASDPSQLGLGYFAPDFGKRDCF
ncbi:MAG: hypothetical protein V2J08_07970 [Desulfotignum sp.]|jgi:hypothetical protein|nr:hypothetical protein [Desulfotignum sp.]